MKEQSLLRRFRWPLFTVCFSSMHVTGLAFYYHDVELTTIGFTVFLFAAFVAVVLNAIDEQRENDRQRDNVMGPVLPSQEEAEGGVGR